MDDGYVIDDHVGSMLAEATRLHKAAMSHLSTPSADPMSQLLKAQKLLEQAEVLASDGASYIDATQMDDALAELHRQQGEVRAMIAIAESCSKRSNGANFGWLSLVIVITVLAMFDI